MSKKIWQHQHLITAAAIVMDEILKIIVDDLVSVGSQSLIKRLSVRITNAFHIIYIGLGVCLSLFYSIYFHL